MQGQMATQYIYWLLSIAVDSDKKGAPVMLMRMAYNNMGEGKSIIPAILD
jgi:hypothetical protein